MTTWFKSAKPQLKEKNACMNLPYILDGDVVVTQFNTCALYLGKKLGIDVEANFLHNHTVLDQVMDLRNDLMKIVYPPGITYGLVKTKDEFPAAAKNHLVRSATDNLAKLEGFCKGLFMCGPAPQSGDFHVFEMLDEHVSICKSIGEPNILEGYPKLSALYAAMLADPALTRYFESDFHTKYSQNNPLFCHFTGVGEDLEYGPTVEETIMFDTGFTLGYHKIRGLGAPLRMMFYYKSQSFTNVAYGADVMTTWFKSAKPQLKEKNACMNLPYILDGDVVVTQFNTCALYLGKKLGIDVEANFLHNHTVLDQVMDLRNDLMKIVYPPGITYGLVKTKDEFPAAAKNHLVRSATDNLAKLEGFCKGLFMCGPAPQSGDFHVFEMLDEHVSICKSIGEPNILEGYPKLSALYAAMLADPALTRYFESDFHTKYSQNNPLFCHFTGVGEDLEYGPTVEETISL